MEREGKEEDSGRVVKRGEEGRKGKYCKRIVKGLLKGEKGGKKEERL